MTYDEFFNGPPVLCAYYREAHKNKMRERNIMAHYQGAYIYEAMCDVAPLFNFLGKSREAVPYRETPYDIYEEDAARTREKEERKEIEKMKSYIMGFSANKK